ncbi:MAG: RNA polymerase sigma factor [Pseudomonadota bacterium]
MDACATDLDAEAERRLLQAARLSADSVAFTRLVSPHVAPIRRYLERFTQDGADADDLTQETLVTAWRRLDDYDGRGRFKAWLFAIAYREFLQHARSRRRFWRALGRLRSEPTAETVSGDAPAASADLERLLDALEPEARALVLMSKGVGLSHAEIAEITGKPLGTVKSVINRATRRLIDEHA